MRGLGLGLRLRPSGGSAGPTPGQQEAAAWALAAGAGATEVGQEAIEAFMALITGTAVEDKLHRVNLLIGSDLTAVRTPLPSFNAGGATDANTGLLIGDYTETGLAGGLKGNATDKYLDTGFASNLLTVDNRMLAVVETVRATLEYAISIGSAEGVNTDNWWLGTDEFVNITRYRQSATYEGADFGPTLGATAWIGSSVDADEVVIYEGQGASIVQSLGAVTVPLTATTTTVKVLAAGRPAGAASNPSDARIGAYVIGEALNFAEAQILNDALRAAMLVLGRTA